MHLEEIRRQTREICRDRHCGRGLIQSFQAFDIISMEELGRSLGDNYSRRRSSKAAVLHEQGRN